MNEQDKWIKEFKAIYEKAFREGFKMGVQVGHDMTVSMFEDEDEDADPPIDFKPKPS